MSNRGVSPQSCRDAVIGCVREYVRQHGTKRGLHLAAAAIGVSDRVARHAHEGTPFAADAERAARADAARLALLTETIAALVALRDEVEKQRHEASTNDAVIARVRTRPRGGAVANAGQRMDRSRHAVLA